MPMSLLPLAYCRYVLTIGLKGLQESVIRPQEARMTLGEELRRKYALTSLKPKGSALAVLAINEALEVAAELADQEHADIAASRIRSLKWADRSFAPDSLGRCLPFDKAV
jgi:hypothetical protein